MHIFDSNFTYRYVMRICRSSSNLVLPEQFLAELWPLDITNFLPFTVSAPYLLSECTYFSHISYIDMPEGYACQVRICFRSINFWQSYDPWTKKIFSNLQFPLVTSAMNAHIWLRFHIYLCYEDMQVKLEFGSAKISFFGFRRTIRWSALHAVQSNIFFQNYAPST